MPLINIILNSSNVIGTYNTQFLFKFLNGSFTINEGSEICISQIIIPYSWFNINAGLYQNATLQYIWYYGAGLSTTYTVTFPNGYYAISDLNNYLQQYMISQNHYLINNSTSQYSYYIQLYSNTTYYANQIVVSSLPTSLPSGYSAPTAGFNGTNGYPTTTLTPRVVIPSNGIGSILGYTAGTYPPSTQTTSYSTISNTTPNATPVNSVIVQCDKVNNPCSVPSNVLDTFTINSTFGSNITYTPSYEKWIGLAPGTYSNLIITFCDQNYNLIQANDPNILISLLLKQGPKKRIIPYEPYQLKPSIKQIRKLEFNDVPEEE